MWRVTVLGIVNYKVVWWNVEVLEEGKTRKRRPSFTRATESDGSPQGHHSSTCARADASVMCTVGVTVAVAVVVAAHSLSLWLALCTTNNQREGAAVWLVRHARLDGDDRLRTWHAAVPLRQHNNKSLACHVGGGGERERTCEASRAFDESWATAWKLEATVGHVDLNASLAGHTPEEPEHQSIKQINITSLKKL